MRSTEGCLHRRWRWVGVLAAFALGGCGQGEVGGGGIEIPNGFDLKVSVSGSEGSAPPSGMQVRLLARDSWAQRWSDGKPVVLDSARTDASGQVRFSVRADEGYWVEAIDGKIGGRLNVDAPGERTLQLSPLSSLEGAIDSGERAGVMIRLWGSTRTVRTDGSGRFRFDSIPQGQWSLVGQGDEQPRIASLGRVEVGPSARLAAGLQMDTSNLLLDDFADSNSIWALDGQFGNGGYWWVSSEAPVKQVFGVDGAWQSITGTGSERRISVKPDSALVTGSWANVGLNFGSNTSVLPDFSRARAVRVRVRGTGVWSVRLAERQGGELVNWQRNLTTTPDWTEVVLPVASFKGPEPSFASGPRFIRELVFQIQREGELEISRLSVDGLALSDWGR
ncbi:MAG: hypothetical protein IPK50_10055 [Fibrobacterota bacterium]|nr:hypothetical protein [Fibrobacterota bacterium]QQS07221.1 MAG: hypothetical protein IPK50_10055 [Fibrobacterota bacterium]